MNALVRFPLHRSDSFPVLDLAALDETLEHIFMLAEKAAAEQGMALESNLDYLHVPGWNQNSWISTDEHCNTAYCVAGWRAAQDGLQVYNGLGGIGWCFSVPHPSAAGISQPMVDIRDWFAQRIGLSRAEAEVMCAGENLLSDLKQMQEALHAGHQIGVDAYGPERED